MALCPRGLPFCRVRIQPCLNGVAGGSGLRPGERGRCCCCCRGGHRRRQGRKLFGRGGQVRRGGLRRCDAPRKRRGRAHLARGKGRPGAGGWGSAACCGRGRRGRGRKSEGGFCGRGPAGSCGRAAAPSLGRCGRRERRKRADPRCPICASPPYPGPGRRRSGRGGWCGGRHRRSGRSGRCRWRLRRQRGRRRSGRRRRLPCRGHRRRRRVACRGRRGRRGCRGCRISHRHRGRRRRVLFRGSKCMSGAPTTLPRATARARRRGGVCGDGPGRRGRY
jgi:hypothetical protein